jgi:hypothetical protein
VRLLSHKNTYYDKLKVDAVLRFACSTARLTENRRGFRIPKNLRGGPGAKFCTSQTCLISGLVKLRFRGFFHLVIFLTNPSFFESRAVLYFRDRNHSRCSVVPGYVYTTPSHHKRRAPFMPESMSNLLTPLQRASPGDVQHATRLRHLMYENFELNGQDFQG